MGAWETDADDHQVAWQLARQAGQRLLAIRAAGDTSAQALRDSGDRLSHEYLAAELARLRPEDAVLSEEGIDDPRRLSARRVWIVDPLDGTREFGEPGRSDWAVHVALWQDGELTAGAVALPASDEVLGTWQPASAPVPAPGAQLRLVVSRSRPPEFVTRLAAGLGAAEVPMGSAGAKAAAVITGQADAYVHSGGQYEWDSAAPVAAAQAAGLHCSRIDGSALRYNQADPRLPDILICSAGLAPGLLDAIKAAMAGAEAGDTPAPRGETSAPGGLEHS